MSRGATLSLMGLWQFDNTILSQMILPAGVDPLTGEEKLVQRKITQIRRVDGSDAGSLAAGEIGVIYGLGENIRGINKRGWTYTSYATDEPNQTESIRSLYGAHNFFIVDGKDRFGVFIDHPGEVEFDVGYTRMHELRITPVSMDMDVYIIEGESINTIVKNFRKLIGRSYLPPKWAFGFIQSRFGGISEESVNETLAEYEKLGIPIDSFCVDIDGLDEYQNFTWHKENFPDPERFVKEKLEEGIHLVPIVDVAIRKDEKIPEYITGAEDDVFCRNDQGEDFVGYVWPGTCVFPDYFQEKTRKWFGHAYQRYLNMGVHGFWNDMNEPAVFAEPEGFKRGAEKLNSICEEYSFHKFGELMDFQKILYDPQKAGDKFQHFIKAFPFFIGETLACTFHNLVRAAADKICSSV